MLEREDIVTGSERRLLILQQAELEGFEKGGERNQGKQMVLNKPFRFL
jgi:hypothetical protein